MVDMVAQTDLNDKLFEERVDALNSWATARGLPARVRERLEDSLKYTLRARSAFDEAEMLRQLPSFLRNRAAAAMPITKPVLFEVPFLKVAVRHDIGWIPKLLSISHPFQVLKGEEVVTQGQTSSQPAPT